MLSLYPLALSSSSTFSVSSNAPPHLRPSLPIHRICLPSRLRRSLAFSLSFSPPTFFRYSLALHSPALIAFLFQSIHLSSPPLLSAPSPSTLIPSSTPIHIPPRFSVNDPRVECTMTRCCEWDPSTAFWAADLSRDVCRSDLRCIQTQWRMIRVSFPLEIHTGLVMGNAAIAPAFFLSFVCAQILRRLFH
jgi:hypothetical protein